MIKKNHQTNQPTAADKRILLGRWGEGIAHDYLVSSDWKILSRNEIMRDGELDLIATKPIKRGSEHYPLVAFVEVKTRVINQRLLPEASVTRQKRLKIIKLAKKYARRHKLYGRAVMRFDVIAITLKDDILLRDSCSVHELITKNPDYELKYIPSAFDALGRV